MASAPLIDGSLVNVNVTVHLIQSGELRTEAEP